MPRTPSMLVPHKAILVNGDTIEYEGAHPTAWTVGGVDDNGRANGTPVQTLAVTAIIPGTVATDDYTGFDPRDAEIDRLRQMVAELRAKRDPRDSQITQLKAMVDELLTDKASVNEVQLTPEEIKANEDALAEYKPGRTVQDVVPAQEPSLATADTDGYTAVVPPEIPPELRGQWEQFIAEHKGDV